MGKYQPHAQPYYSSPSDDTSLGHASSMALVPMASLLETSNFSLAMHLHRMYNLVLSCQESMWEVLNDKIRNREDDLKRLGWLDDSLEGEHSRERFESLLVKYQRYVYTLHLVCTVISKIVQGYASKNCVVVSTGCDSVVDAPSGGQFVKGREKR